MHYLTPRIQTYAWGSRSFIQGLLSEYQEDKIAELWLGAHPKAPAGIEGQALDALLMSDPDYWFGAEAKAGAARLPYLLKVLAADEPLSIQVHPSKAQAEQGFARENVLGVPLDGNERNYKDDNHKPELIMALTPFDALCGIRDYPEIIELFRLYQLDTFFASFAAFALSPDRASFTELYMELLSGETKGIALHLQQLESKAAYAEELVCARQLLTHYPDDPFVIAPFIMNLIRLRPHDAIFLEAGIPHAYLKGAGVEIMASSDNVLRAGLTPKHIDKDELLAIARLEPYLPELLTVPDPADTLHYYPCPSQDFRLASCDLKDKIVISDIRKPAIILCLEGYLRLHSSEQELILTKGKAAIATAADAVILAKGPAYFVVAQPG